MPRPLRFQYPGAYYHVMNRGANKCPIFIDPKRDRNMFKKSLAAAVDMWKIRIHAYSLMSNHYHLLVETPLGNLSRAMQHIDGKYTQCFNKAHKRDGPLLRGRFKSILIQEESYFLELVRYIHLNGVKAGLQPSANLDLNCSHPDYLSPLRSPRWLTQQAVLSYFPGDDTYRRDQFNRFVHKAENAETIQVLSSPRWPTILGSNQFIEKIQTKFNLMKPCFEPNVTTKKEFTNNPISTESIFDRFPHLSLEQRSRTETRQDRWTVMYWLRHGCYLSHEEIGKHFGGICEKAVRSFLQKYDFADTTGFNEIREWVEKEKSEVRV